MTGVVTTVDPVMLVAVIFTASVLFRSAVAAVYVELVAPDGEESKLLNASKKKIPLNHLCYRCSDIEAATAQMRDQGCLVLEEPVAAVAFDGRRISWLITGERLLVELVERGPEGSL